ncbi:MAG: mechanosensitive ion channel family protein, partial [Pseudomonadota bacterium]
PALGPQFLQPLKSQGVIQMEDSAMIMRVKFMTKPGDQWVIRRTVFAKIRDLFEREGIKFAHREVTVRLADESNGEHLSEQERKAISAAARSTFDDTSTGPAVTGDTR